MLKDYISIETGSMNLDENNPNGKYDFYTRNEGIFKCEKYTHDCSGVIVAGEGNFKPKFAKGKFGLHQRAYLLKSLSNVITNEILNEIVNSNIEYLNGVAVGSTVKSLRKNSFENMPFYLDGDYTSISYDIKKIYELISDYSNKINNLNILKNIFLNKFFS